jgi:hypothetical protein
MDKEADSTDVTNSPGSNARRMVHASSVHTVAPEATPCGTMDVGESRTQKQWDLTLQDFMDFMQRTRWKLSRSNRGSASVGNNLTVIDMGLHQ